MKKSKLKDSVAEQVYSILCQCYEGELDPDDGFQQILDIFLQEYLEKYPEATESRNSGEVRANTKPLRKLAKKPSKAGGE